MCSHLALPITRLVRSSNLNFFFNSRFVHSQKCLFYPIQNRQTRWTTIEEAIKVIKSGDHIFVHCTSATPKPLLNSLCDHAKSNKLKRITLHHTLLMGDLPTENPEYEGIIRHNCIFVSANLRRAVNSGRADCISMFLSETPDLFRKGYIDLDAAFITVSPPDRKGYCTLGTTIDCSLAAVQNAKYIIALSNPKMPRVFGDGIIHMSQIDAMVDCDFDLPEVPDSIITEEENKIGKYIAENLVVDSATLQMGIGTIPNAVLNLLKGHKKLGIHSEMFSDGILQLVECNAVTNEEKRVLPGRIVGSFCMGSRKLYDFIDDNPTVVMGDVKWVNDTTIICQNPKVTAINSCVEVDLTGQVVSDSVGKNVLSGFGGQIDFIRGAALSNDGQGKPIIALNSITKKGQSKIVPHIKQNAGVVTTRGHVHYVVTEYGIAHLFGKNFRQRAHSLIKIAHPDCREQLEKAAFSLLGCMPSPDK